MLSKPRKHERNESSRPRSAKEGFESEGPRPLFPRSPFLTGRTERGAYTKLSASLIRRDEALPWLIGGRRKKEVKPKGIRNGNSGRGPTPWSWNETEKGGAVQEEKSRRGRRRWQKILYANSLGASPWDPGGIRGGLTGRLS